MSADEEVGRFGRVRKRVSDRHTCGYIALQYLRHKNLSIYQRTSYLTVLYYAFLCTGSETLLGEFEGDIDEMISMCASKVKAGEKHKSLYRDPRQMFLALSSVSWHYYISRGDKPKVLEVLRFGGRMVELNDFTRLSLSLNASYILLWLAIFESESESDEKASNLWKPVVYLQRVASNIDISMEMTHGSLFDFSRCSQVAAYSKAILASDDKYSAPIALVKNFNRVSQGGDKEQTRIFYDRFLKLLG